MSKTNKNVKFFVLIAFLIAAVVCLLLMGKVGINYNISDYLDEETETKISLGIIEKEFGLSGDVQVMIEDVEIEEAYKIKEIITGVDKVVAVSFDETSTDFYKDKTALFTVLLDGDEYSESARGAVAAIEDVLEDTYGERLHMGGTVAEKISLRNAIQTEIALILAISLCLVAILMLITAKSWLEPFVILAAAGVAVLLNMGTNIIFGEISYITNAVAAILQLALSMDYSIMLLHAFRDMKKEESDIHVAMNKAVKSVMSPVSASALTTIAGLLALLFMSFRIGFDIGIVLMKSIVLSAITALTLLPALLLIFDKLLEKTKKRELVLKGKSFCTLAFKGSKVILPIALVIIVGCCILQTGNSYSFTDASNKNQNIVGTFGENNTVIIVYENSDSAVEKERELSAILKSYKKADGTPIIKKMTSLAETVKAEYDVDAAAETLGVPVERAELLFAVYHLRENSKSVKISSAEFLGLANELIETDPDASAMATEEVKKALGALMISGQIMNNPHTPTELCTLIGNSGFVPEEKLEALAPMIKQMYGILLYDKIEDKTVSMLELLNFIPEAQSNPLASGFITPKTVETIKNLLEKSGTTKQYLEEQETLLISTKADLESKKAELEAQKQELPAQKQALLEKKEEITAQKSELLELKNNLTAKKAEVLATRSELITTKEDLIVQRADVEEALAILKEQLETAIRYNFEQSYIVYLTQKISEAEDGLNQIDDGLSQIDAGLAQIAAGLLEIDAGFEEINGYLVQIEAGFIEIDSYLSQIDDGFTVIDGYLSQIDDGLAQIEDGFAQIEAGYAQLEATEAALNAKYGYEGFIDAIKEISTPMLQPLEETKQELGAKKQELTSTLEDLNTQLEEATKLGDGAAIESLTQEISELEAEIAEIDADLAETEESLSSFESLSNIPAEAVQQLYILYFQKNNAIPDEKISGQEFVNAVLTTAEENKIIGEFITDETKAMLESLITANEFLADETQLTYTELAAKLNELSAALPNMGAGEISTDILMGVYAKHAASNEELFKGEKISAETLVTFLSDGNLPLVELTKEQETAIADAKAALENGKALLVSDNYTRLLLSVDLPAESEESYKFARDITADTKKVFGESAHVAGEIISTNDLAEAFDYDNKLISIFTIVSIFVIIMLVFRSFSLPVLLVAIIQGAIWIAMSTSLITGPMFFMSYIMATCILMGATIDYGILMSTSYVNARATLDKKDALLRAVEIAMPTVFTSGLILMICGFVVGLIASQTSISSVGFLLFKGTLVSTIMITVVLPSILYILDGFILKLTLRKKNK